MLSRDWKTQKPQSGRIYDFVIVGSGYGGAITAARIAGAGLNKSICLLERGKEWEVGKFPDTVDGYVSESRGPLNRLGLYEILNYDPISVIKGNGLGGTSLVNANVAIVPDEDVFAKLEGWPSAINQAELLPFYAKAREMLAVSAHPHLAELLKYQSLKLRADELGLDVQALDLAVNFTIDGENEHGAKQVPCTNCGDCVTGCNTGAKNTLYMNYLPAAARANVEMFTRMNVEWVEARPGGGWRVHGTFVATPFDPLGLFDEDFQIDTHNVILSAGAINTTEILLRSSNLHGLSVSPMVGSRFGGNGDFFGLSYNGDTNLESLGWGNHPPNPNPSGGPGPTITAALRYNAGAPLGNRFTIEDLSFPRAFVRAAQQVFASPFLQKEDTDAGDTAAEEFRMEKDRRGANQYDPNGALNNTMIYLCMGFDDARGHFKWEVPFLEPNGRVSIVWPGAGGQPIFGMINEEIRRLARSLGGSFVANPLWTFGGLRRLITAHPLGGCPIGEDHVSGAVDQYGRLFAGDGSIHKGLFVADGSTLPSALGVNPFLTISAVSERIAHHKILEMGGTPYPERTVTAGFSGISAIDVVNWSEPELDRHFQASPAGNLDGMVNVGGPPTIDTANRQIVSNDYWKGFFPKGHVLNQMSALVFTSFRKKFWKDDNGRYLGKTSDTDKHILADNTLEEIEIKDQTGDLRPGRYILLRYTNPEWRNFYDIFRVINNDVLIGRVYMGEFPNGLRLFTFPMTRRYDYSQMTVIDHEQLWATARVPTKLEMQGAWRMDTISNANSSSGVAFLEFDNKPDGKLEARYQLMGLLEGLVVPTFVRDHFQLNDFTQFHDEIRVLEGNLLIGKWITDLPAGLPLPANDLGIFHSAKDAATGKDTFGFYYLLHKAGAGLPMSRLFDPILGAALPKGTGLNFDETMEGWYFPDQGTPSPDRAGDLTIAARIPESGRPSDAVECKFTVHMKVADMNDFIDGPDHEARLSGDITFGSFNGSANATFIVDDRRSYFNYLRVNPATREAEMRYHIEFQADGKTFSLEGRKYMQKDEVGAVRSTREVLDDYTTLYTHVYEHAADGKRELGTGLLKFRTFEDVLAVGNLAGFLASFRVTGDVDPRVRFLAQLKFYAFTGRFVQLEYDPLASEISVGAVGG